MLKKNLFIFLLMSISLSLFASLPTNGLIASYPFNGNANNAVANINNGSTNNAFLTSDRFGNPNNAYQFNGYSNQWIYLGDDPIGDNESVSFTADIYPTIPSYNGYTPAENKYIISTGAQSGSIGYYLLWNNGRLRAGRKTTDAICDTLFGDFTPNKWYHIIFTYDHSSQIYKIYVNNILWVNACAKVGPTNLTHIFKDMLIGRPNTNYDANFEGKIDDINIYNKALSEFEIQQIYNNGVTEANSISFENRVKVYTNARHDQVIIDFGNDFDTSVYDKFKILNSFGQCLYQSDLVSKVTHIDTKSMQTKGICFVELLNKQNKRIVVKKVVLH